MPRKKGKPGRPIVAAYYIKGWGWGINETNHTTEKWRLLEVAFNLEDVAKECQTTYANVKKILDSGRKWRVNNTFLEIQKIEKW